MSDSAFGKILLGGDDCQWDHRMAAVRDECTGKGTHVLLNRHGEKLQVCRIVAEDFLKAGNDPHALCKCGKHIRECWTVRERVR